MDCVCYERKELSYEDLSGKFKLNNRDFNRQYAHIYAVRLMKFEPLLRYRVLKKWGMNFIIKKKNSKLFVYLQMYRICLKVKNMK